MENKIKSYNSNKNDSKGKNRNKFNKKEKKKSKSELASEEIDLLNKRIINELPPTGKYSISTEEQNGIDESKLEVWEKPYPKFKDLPISSKTIQGLNSSKYFNLTPIQRCTLPHTLGGRDLLGASKTGSGKTLCFLIPVLENLYREGWVKEEGLGALILLPTRELAIQVFEVINKIGKYHNFSVGMVIGGNDYEKERYVVSNMNILIGTPGRVLQHMSESYMFNADNLKMLVIDEADRILDEGFEEELLKLLNYLPKNRQTMLFSATLTRNLKRLVKIHMRSPEYINLSNTDSVLNAIENINKNELSIMKVNNNNSNNVSNDNNSNDLIIPKNLNQFYTIVEPEDRINILYSFLKTHKTSKCLVFVSSRKQVRYFTEVFKHLKLGMLFLDIHGKQKQGKRSSTFYTFSEKRNSVVLFATDIASRGVDFPAIDWVIQLDPPEDISQYIHRVGRTARYKSDGNSVLFVSEKENNFINELKIRKINILKMKIPQNKINNIVPVVRSLLSEHKELIELAEKAITSYVKSINLTTNKSVFNIKNIDLGKLALSYGLVSSPEMIVKTKNEVEKEQNEEDLKKIDLKKKKIEEEKNLMKDNLINNNADNKKKSKLFKLKEKIKLKKLMKQKEKEKENNNNKEENTKKDEIELEEEEEEKDEFLTVKKDKNDKKEKKEDEIKLGEKRKRSKSKNENNSNSSDKEKGEKSDDDEEENEFYNKIKKRLNENKEIDKKKEKERISNKHKEDRLKLKEKDYLKHGIEIEEDNNAGKNKKNKKYSYEEESQEEDDIDEDIEKDEEEDEDNKKDKKPKIKININHSTLKEKENAAMEILRKKGIL